MLNVSNALKDSIYLLMDFNVWTLFAMRSFRMDIAKFVISKEEFNTFLKTENALRNAPLLMIRLTNSLAESDVKTISTWRMALVILAQPDALPAAQMENVSSARKVISVISNVQNLIKSMITIPWNAYLHALRILLPLKNHSMARRLLTVCSAQIHNA